MKQTIKLPQEIYNASLKEIHGCVFSAREIEIIAAILLDKPTQQIPDILSITDVIEQDFILYGYKLSERTVASHIDNIYEKLSFLLKEHKDDLRNKITKRDKIKYVIQKSTVRGVFEEYCVALQIENAFLNQVEKIFQKQLHIEERQATIGYCQIYYDKKIHGLNLSNSLLYIYLARHLNDRRNKNEPRIITTFLNEEILDGERKSKIDYFFYIVPDDSRVHLGLEGSKVNKTILDLIERASKNSYRLFFLLDNWKTKKQIPEAIKRVGYVHFGGQENYYESFFEILKKMFPDVMFEEEIKTFKKDYATLNPTESSNLERKKLIGLCLLCIGILSTGIVMHINSNFHMTNAIRSDLPIPHEDTLLKRSEILEQIDDKLKGQQGIQTLALVGVVGMGGVGKTTLARQFGRLQKSSVVWEINAETKESLVNSFKDLAYGLAKTVDQRKELDFIQEIKNTETREKRLFYFIKQHLKENHDWILIYDNVETFSKVKDYFPQNSTVWGSGKIILTTRDSNIKNSNYVKPEHIVQVEELNNIEALTLFSKILFDCNPNKLQSTQKEMIINFLKNIPPFPLDISVAAYYIKNFQISYEQYLKYIEKNSKDFINIQKNFLENTGDYFKTRYSIVTLTLKNLIDIKPEFIDLFLFISIIDSQNIPRELLSFYKKDIIVDDFIYNLKKHSFITIDSLIYPISTFSIHRSTQNIILSYLIKELKLETNTQKLEQILNILENYMVDIIDKDDFCRMRTLVNQCEKFLSHHSLLTTSMKSTISSYLGEIYFYLGDYKKSKSLLEESYKKLNTNDIKVTRTLTNLGILYREIDNFAQSQKILEESILIHKKNPLKNLDGFARSLGALGSVYRSLGNYKKAKELFEESLEIYNKNSFHKKNIISGVLANLGNTYRDLGCYEKAKKFLEESLIIYKKNFSKNPTGFAGALTYLGTVYRDLGNHRKSKELFEQSLTIYKDQFPENHIKIAWVLGLLGKCYRDLGYYEKSKEFLEESLTIYRKSLPENHFRIAWVLGNLGATYNDLGNYEKAKIILEDNINIHKKNYEGEHLKATWILLHLGNTYKNLGDYKKAKPIFEKNLVIYEKNYGKKHVETARILRDLGQLYFLDGDMKTSEVLLNKALQILQKNKHSESYTVLEILAEFYLKKFTQEVNKIDIKQSRIFRDKYFNYLKQALKIVETHFSINSSHTKRIQSKLRKVL